jgi:hypothetical protein
MVDIVITISNNQNIANNLAIIRRLRFSIFLFELSVKLPSNYTILPLVIANTLPFVEICSGFFVFICIDVLEWELLLIMENGKKKNSPQRRENNYKWLIINYKCEERWMSLPQKR